MNPIKKLNPRTWGGLVGALISVIAGLGVYQNNWSRALENSSYNLLFYPRPVTPVDDAVIVYLDEESHKELDQKFN